MMQRHLPHLAALFPDRKKINGHLLLAPDRRHLLYVTFETASGSNAIYFDISHWAEYEKTE